ncbi:molybdopterin-dependent oxidoreductase [Candidatus Micrarchaeota archaeon]|nr:molybdopterin-dependent oxidoreductase [Candidatus Micrarchaeota archaeon]
MRMGFSAALLLVLLLFFGCAAKPSNLQNLSTVQVQDYQGEDLSSINDFRENSIKGPQYIETENYMLRIDGLVESPADYTYQEVLDDFQHYQKIVTLDCVEGWSVTILWEGVLVKDIIEKAKPTQDAKVVIFHAADGYTTSFPLEYLTQNSIIIAYKMNNVTLPPERGYPFQLVAESKWGYKWIKWITEIEFSDDENYQGYWERRGYSNSGNLNESFFG